VVSQGTFTTLYPVTAPSLGVVAKAANSPVPALGYAGVYDFGVIILTVAGQVMILSG
jgi:putative transport protein